MSAWLERNSNTKALDLTHPVNRGFQICLGDFAHLRCIQQYNVNYRGELKGSYVLLSRTQAGPGRARQGQAEQLRKSRKIILATTYKPFS